ncbi:MAG: HAMP domain-containing protein, partial [Waddliaceae bacterium]
MIRKRLIYQLFPSYLAIIIIVVFALIWFTNWTLQDFYYKEKRDDLEARAILVGKKISADGIEDTSYLTKICRDLGQATGTRITIISQTGKVLGDSHENPEIMDNHGDRPEVIVAYQGNAGTSIRYSHTLEQEMMYLAIPIKVGEKSIIVRTSLPVTSLQETISAMRVKIIFGGIVITLLATLVNFIVSRRIARPLEEMKQGAERFAHGQLDHKLTVPGTEEIGALANTLNQMANQLDRRIKTILRQRNEQEA